MLSLSSTLEELEKKLPDFCLGLDLVAYGIVPSISTLGRLCRNGQGPAYVKCGPRSIRFPKQAVLEFVQNNWHTGQALSRIFQSSCKDELE